MSAINLSEWMMILTFIVGYFLITIEGIAKINKAGIALMMAIICWIIQFNNPNISFADNLGTFNHHLADISGIFFFILGALAVVELISQHRGFEIITDLLKIRSKKKMLWLVTVISFFLSSVLDNLTTTVVMVTILRKLLDKSEDRLILGSAVVVAANAGGAWTPIGDVTTTMLWIGGQITSLGVIKSLLIPSVVCAMVASWLLSFNLKGDFDPETFAKEEKKTEPCGKVVFFLGIALVIFIPIFKTLTGLPPFMGVLFALSTLWLLTDMVHGESHEREHLRMPYVLTRIDLSGVFFFMGILLCINALYSAGLLTSLAQWIDSTVGNLSLIAVFIGLASAIVDNVPLVAATMGMYDMTSYPVDHQFWQMIAYAAGTGGSILIVGSAAGVILMGMEKVNFFWYARKVGVPALVGFAAGFLTFQAAAAF